MPPTSDLFVQCVDQAELEKFDGVSQGKYTIGLGQTKMSFCDDREGMQSFFCRLSPKLTCFVTRYLLFCPYHGVFTSPEKLNRSGIDWSPRSRHRDSPGQVEICQIRPHAAFPAFWQYKHRGCGHGQCVLWWDQCSFQRN